MTTDEAIAVLRAFIERRALKRNSGEASSNEDDFVDVQLKALAKLANEMRLLEDMRADSPTFCASFD